MIAKPQAKQPTKDRAVVMVDDPDVVLKKAVDHIDQQFSQRKNGLAGLFSESLLTISLAEALHGHGWGIEIERDYRWVTELADAPAGYLNYDLLATSRRGVRCLFELKYLKSPKAGGASYSSPRTALGYAGRLIDDILRVAHPRLDGLRRFVVIGREQELQYPERFARIAKRAEQPDAGFRIMEAQLPEDDVLAPTEGLLASIEKIKQARSRDLMASGCTLRKLDIGADPSCATVIVDIFEVSGVDWSVQNGEPASQVQPGVGA